MSRDFDLVVTGAGFAGSLLAMVARRLGLSVAVVEKGRHPRFAIGESSTPLANLLLEELAAHYGLPRLLPLCKWGPWQSAYPEIACGLKRGFTFYHHEPGRAYAPDPGRLRQLLVAASPHDGIADTHWYRPDFDHFLLREAVALGAEYLDETALDSCDFSPSGAELRGNRHNRQVTLRARFVCDASGPRGFLHRVLGLAERPFAQLPSTQSLYSHFTGVKRWEDLPGRGGSGTPPYPVDDAALHHVFPGGWIWVLRFNNGITSAGVAARDGVAEELGFRDGAAAWDRLLRRLPAVEEQFAEARPAGPERLGPGFVHARRLSFQCGPAAGPQWALLPSAAGFVDPLLSTGFPLALLGITRLAEALERDWGTPRFPERMREYADRSAEELDATQLLVAALYARMSDPELFAGLARLYFAAAGFSETARRLGKPELAAGFLLVRNPGFGPGLRACALAALGDLTAPGRAALLARIRETLDPFDVAGLGDPARGSWYPVEAEDLFRSAPKLGAGREDIAALLARCGFVPEGLSRP